MSFRQSFADYLKAYRTDMAWTQKELGDNWGFSAETISAWERGKRFPRRQQLPNIARLMEMELEELVQSIRATTIDREGSKAQEADMVELQQSNSITEFSSQKKCEPEILEASLQARKVKILTIRGEKYFIGSKSILSHFFSLDVQKEDVNIEVLVLSPDAKHITNELAETLEHHSAEEIRETMRIDFEYLKLLSRRYKNFQVRYYIQKPNFKLLFFDDILFVSAYVTSKNDDHANMFKMAREGNSLFIGFEKLFDELWEKSVELK